MYTNARYPTPFRNSLHSSQFKVKDKNEYDLDFKSSSPDPKLLLTGDELIAFYKEMIEKYPIKWSPPSWPSRWSSSTTSPSSALIPK